MTPELLLAVAGTFVLVGVSVAWGTSQWVGAHAAGPRRLRTIAEPMSTPVSRGSGLLTPLDPMLARLSKLLPRKSATQQSRIQRRLTRAGYRHPHAVAYFSVAQMVLPVALGGIALLVVGLSQLIYVAAAAAVGFILPGTWLNHKTKVRQRAIRNGLPDFLDLLTLCVEAGTGLDGAITKATSELEISHPTLAEETRLMTTEVRAGRPRIEAFANFAARTGVQEVRTLVSMLSQTDRFGTSIGQALRMHADTERTIRRQRAQERAGKVNVKLVFPLAFCLFPALYVVAFGPVALKVYRTLLAPGS